MGHLSERLQKNQILAVGRTGRAAILAKTLVASKGFPQYLYWSR